MAPAQASVPSHVRTELGHLAVKVDGLRPDELVFSFERQPKRLSGALLGSLLTHGALALLFVVLTLLPDPKPSVDVPVEPPREIVWLAIPGPGGGGGGGGDPKPQPPRKIELPGKEKISVPVAKPPELAPPKKVEPEPPPQNLTIPVQTVAASNQQLPGVIEAVGEVGGAGSGPGTGAGEGTGSGSGPGEGGGIGGGAYRLGSGVESPQPILRVKPNYTADAMRAKVQGMVVVEAIVMPDGTVNSARVVRSLDQTFGLDQEALKAAKQWRFQPGTRFGRPVPVWVNIELAFTLR
jgi:protein TonB